jgi:dTDP-glucose pyrophosphorylase
MTFVDAVVIPAAGAGSRFNELGKQYPKCCLPYQEKPIIRHIVERTMHLGKEVRIITSNQEQEDAIRYALELNGKIDKEIKFFKVDLSLVQGPATSLYAGLHDLDTAIVFLSDAIPVLPDSLDHDANKVYTSIVPDWARWCMVKTVDSHSIKFFDKPQDRPPTNTAACGVYSLKNVKDYIKAFEDLQHSGETQFSHVFERMQYRYGCSFQAPIWNGELLDFGTLSEYIANRSIRKERVFNNITVDDIGNNTKIVTKRSTDTAKLMAEASFIQNLPQKYSVYYPRVNSIDVEKSMYTMDYIYAPSLRDIALFLDKSYETWVEIFNSINRFIKLCETSISRESSSYWGSNFLKNVERLRSANLFLPEIKDKYVRDYAFLENLQSELSARFGDSRTMYHGDLHFANMFYDFNTKQLKLVDPRGEFSGHWFYDMAKLMHSVVGKYDYIDSQLYSITSDGEAVYYDKGHEQIIKAFRDVFGEETDLLRKLTASLFLTMIPLHKDNPTNMRLFYKEYERLLNAEETTND